MGGVTFARLNKLYLLTMLTLAGSPCLGGAGGTPVGGGGGGGMMAAPPIAPCSGGSPALTSCSWFINNQALTPHLSSSKLLT